MYNMKQFLLAVPLTLIILSCSDKDENNESPKSNSCLSDYITTPCDMVSKEDFAELAEINVANLEVEKPEEISLEEVNDYSNILCTFSWPSDRVSIMTIEVGDTEVKTEVPLKNVVSIGDIEVIEDEDLLNLNGSKETYADFFHRVRIGDDNPNSERLDGLGDLASLHIIEAASHSNYRLADVRVLHKNVHFNVEVDISDSDEEDVAFARKVATAILENCSK